MRISLSQRACIETASRDRVSALVGNGLPLSKSTYNAECEGRFAEEAWQCRSPCIDHNMITAAVIQALCPDL